MRPETPAKPERWQAATEGQSVLRLSIPADLYRERRFEISVALSVRALESAAESHHALKVFADGQLQWQRRIATARGEPWDGLDLRFSRSVPVGRPLLLLAEAKGEGAKILRLSIEADEI
jgi:hypothetical protein